MTDRDQLLALLLQHEGLRLKPYTDTTGNLTIGIGRNLTGKGISEREAICLVNNDVDDAITDCASFPWFPQLDAARQIALLDMYFNLGPTRFRGFRQMLAAVEQGDFVKASQQMLQSKWATQVGQRARDLARLMATGTALALLLLSGRTAHAQDAIDLSAARIVRSPGDIAEWPATVHIDALTFSPDAGLSFQRSGANWPDVIPPGFEWPILYTVWACARVVVWTCAGFIQMWRTRPSTGAPLPSNSTFWWGPQGGGATAGDFGAYESRPGDDMAFFVSAGNARDEVDVSSVRERSNVVLVRLPAGDSGVFTFRPPTQPPVPTPQPPPASTSTPPASTDSDAFLALLAELEEKIAALEQQEAADTAKILAALPLPAAPLPPEPVIVKGDSAWLKTITSIIAAAGAILAGIGASK
jgi:lysozyme